MKRALLSAVLAALATAAVLATIGFGATANKSSDEGPPPTQADALKTMQAKRDAQQKKLADALGVSAEKLQAALDAAHEQGLAQEVGDGLLTQAQADAIKACKAAPLTCDRSNLPAPRFHDGSGARPSRAEMRKRFEAMRKRHRARQAAFVATLAKELGLDEAKVKEALKANRPERGFGRRGGHGPGGPGMGGHGGPGMGGPGGPPPGYGEGGDGPASDTQPGSGTDAVLT